MNFFWKRFLSLGRKTANNQPGFWRSVFNFVAGVRVQEDTAMQVAAYYRAVMYISTQVSKLPWVVKDSKNLEVSHKITRLLDLAPNSEMSAMSFRLAMVINAINHGNAFAEIERDKAGRPINLWPIPSDCVQFYRDASGKLFYWVSGSNALGENFNILMDPYDIFHIKNFHTRDGVVGQGVVAYGSQVLGIAIASDKMASNLFKNAGMPSGVLSTPGKVSPEARERMRESWNKRHGVGEGESGGTALLEEGVTFTAINMDPDVMQFLESRKFSVLEVSRFTGVPPTKLFDASAATFNNQENSNLEVANDTLHFWVRQLEVEADIKLLNYRYGGFYTDIDLDEVFRGDKAGRGNYYKDLMQVGAITPNEIRAKEGMAGYEEGDTFYIARNNYAPADRIDEIVDAEIKSKNKSVTTPQKEEPSEEERELTRAAAKFLSEQK